MVIVEIPMVCVMLAAGLGVRGVVTCAVQVNMAMHAMPSSITFFMMMFEFRLMKRQFKPVSPGKNTHKWGIIEGY